MSYNKGCNNPMYGKCHTKVSKNKMSINHSGNKHHYYGKHLSKIHRRKISINARNNYNYGMKGKCHTNETKRKLSNLKLGKKLWPNGRVFSKKHIENLSLASAESAKNNPHNIYSRCHKGYYFSKKNNIKIAYASNIEKEFIEILENNNKVMKYYRCPFIIQYRFKNRFYNYVPDFFVKYKSIIKILEIKNNIKIDKLDKYKFLYANIFCKKHKYKFEVWFKDRYWWVLK